MFLSLESRFCPGFEGEGVDGHAITSRAVKAFGGALRASEINAQPSGPPRPAQPASGRVATDTGRCIRVGSDWDEERPPRKLGAGFSLVPRAPAHASMTLDGSSPRSPPSAARHRGARPRRRARVAPAIIEHLGGRRLMGAGGCRGAFGVTLLFALALIAHGFCAARRELNLRPPPMAGPAAPRYGLKEIHRFTASSTKAPRGALGGLRAAWRVGPV